MVEPKSVLLLQGEERESIHLAETVGGIAVGIEYEHTAYTKLPTCFRSEGNCGINEKLWPRDVAGVVDEFVDVPGDEARVPFFGFPRLRVTEHTGTCQQQYKRVSHFINLAEMWNQKYR